MACEISALTILTTCIIMICRDKIVSMIFNQARTYTCLCLCPYVQRYLQIFLTSPSSLKSSSSQPSQMSVYLFQEPFFFVFLFLEGTLGGVDFSRFSILVLKNLSQNRQDHLNNYIAVVLFSFFFKQEFNIIWHRIFVNVISRKGYNLLTWSI